MKDVAPELLEEVKREFRDRLVKNRRFKELNRLLKAGKATYKEANEQAIILGDALAAAYQNNLSSNVLPDGKMYYNIAKRIIEPTMKKNYELESTYCEAVQTGLNHSANLGIKAIKPELNQDRIDGIINKVSDVEKFDDVKWVLYEPVINFTQAIVDATIKANVGFQYDAGLRPKVVRTSAGKCCAWCDEVAGSYDYPDAPQDVYRRHRHCRCTVEYDPRDGKRQNVDTKKWIDIDKEEKIESRKHVGEPEHQYKFAGDDVVVLKDRSDTWYNNLTVQQKDAIEAFTAEEYSDIYAYLRDKGTGDDDLDNIISNLDLALEQYKLDGDYKFFRGFGAEELIALENGER